MEYVSAMDALPRSNERPKGHSHSHWVLASMNDGTADIADDVAVGE
jgi:hypothetical protein